MGRQFAFTGLIALFGRGTHREGAALDRHHDEGHLIDGEFLGLWREGDITQDVADQGGHVGNVDLAVAVDIDLSIVNCGIVAQAVHFQSRSSNAFTA